ncbi:MAG: hypothetical protein WB992_14725 [Bryobacteraceae bacterium]
MSILVVLRVCAILYLVLIIVDWLRSRRYKRFLLELLPLVALLFVDVLIVTAATGYLAFGVGTSPTIVILIMFGAILLGIAARYIFYLQAKFSWLDFAKPLCISPILLLPLMGSVQAVKDLQPTQVLSFALLAFQNGFFWQVVLQRAQPRA